MRDFLNGVEGVNAERSLSFPVRRPYGTVMRRVLPAVGLALALLPAERVAAEPAAAAAPAATPVAAQPAVAAEPAAAAPAADAPTATPAATVTPATVTVHTDPFEHLNRRMYAISMGADRAVVGPVAHFYMRVTPAVLRNRITAILYNLGEPRTVINDVLQGRPRSAGKALARLVINTTAGVGGMFDVASHAGLAGSQADFGQTLGRYGVRTGPYLFIPFMGPTNVRDSLGGLIDSITDPLAWATGGLGGTIAGARGGATTLDTRVQADSELRALDDAIDPYATVRSAYLQNRAATIDQARGRAPVLPEFDDPAPPEAPPAAAPAAAAAAAPSAAPSAPPSETAQP